MVVVVVVVVVVEREFTSPTMVTFDE